MVTSSIDEYSIIIPCSTLHTSTLLNGIYRNPLLSSSSFSYLMGADHTHFSVHDHQLMFRYESSMTHITRPDDVLHLHITPLSPLPSLPLLTLLALTHPMDLFCCTSYNWTLSSFLSSSFPVPAKNISLHG